MKNTLEHRTLFRMHYWKSNGITSDLDWKYRQCHFIEKKPALAFVVSIRQF